MARGILFSHPKDYTPRFPQGWKTLTPYLRVVERKE